VLGVTLFPAHRHPYTHSHSLARRRLLCVRTVFKERYRDVLFNPSESPYTNVGGDLRACCACPSVLLYASCLDVGGGILTAAMFVIGNPASIQCLELYCYK
jgi:hypothetical protein